MGATQEIQGLPPIRRKSRKKRTPIGVWVGYAAFGIGAVLLLVAVLRSMKLI
jgi:hypothetical protein